MSSERNRQVTDPAKQCRLKRSITCGAEVAALTGSRITKARKSESTKGTEKEDHESAKERKREREQGTGELRCAAHGSRCARTSPPVPQFVSVFVFSSFRAFVIG